MKDRGKKKKYDEKRMYGEKQKLRGFEETYRLEKGSSDKFLVFVGAQGSENE